MSSSTISFPKSHFQNLVFTISFPQSHSYILFIYSRVVYRTTRLYISAERNTCSILWYSLTPRRYLHSIRYLWYPLNPRRYLHSIDIAFPRTEGSQNLTCTTTYFYRIGLVIIQVQWSFVASFRSAFRPPRCTTPLHESCYGCAIPKRVLRAQPPVALYIMDWLIHHYCVHTNTNTWVCLNSR